MLKVIAENDLLWSSCANNYFYASGRAFPMWRYFNKAKINTLENVEIEII